MSPQAGPPPEPRPLCGLCRIALAAPTTRSPQVRRFISGDRNVANPIADHCADREAEAIALRSEAVEFAYSPLLTGE